MSEGGGFVPAGLSALPSGGGRGGGVKIEIVGRNRESNRGCYEKRMCMLKSREKSADPADLACFSRRFLPSYAYVPSLPKGDLRGVRQIEGGGGGVIFWVISWLLS